MTPREQQRQARQKIGYGPIWLRRVGDAVIVEVEATADASGEPRWVEVIREHYAANFDHCVEPIGMLEQIEGRAGGAPDAIPPDEPLKRPRIGFDFELYQRTQARGKFFTTRALEVAVSRERAFNRPEVSKAYWDILTARREKGRL